MSGRRGRRWCDWYTQSTAVQLGLFVVALVAVVLSVLKTYADELQSPSWDQIYPYFQLTNAVILLVFIIDFSVNTYSAHNKWKWLLSWVGINNLISIVAVMLALAPDRRLFLIILHLNRRSQLKRFYSYFGTENNDVTRELIAGLGGLLCFLLLCGSFVLLLERSSPNSFIINLNFVETGFEWHTAMYFVIVSITTVGYGDISPSSDGAQILTVVMILVGLSLIPYFATGFAKVLVAKPKYRGSFVPPFNSTHICIVGIVEHAALKHFLEELFDGHEKQGLGLSRGSGADVLGLGLGFQGGSDAEDICRTQGERLIAVVLSPTEPSPRVEALLQSPKFCQKVDFIVGSAKETGDLARAQVARAKAVYVVNDLDKPSSLREEEDSVLLSTVAVVKHLDTEQQRQQGSGKGYNVRRRNSFRERGGGRAGGDRKDMVWCRPKVLVSLLYGARGRSLLYHMSVDVVMVRQEFKYSLLGSAAAVPGLLAFFHDLNTPGVAYRKHRGGALRRDCSATDLLDEAVHQGSADDMFSVSDWGETPALDMDNSPGSTTTHGGDSLRTRTQASITRLYDIPIVQCGQWVHVPFKIMAVEMYRVSKGGIVLVAARLENQVVINPGTSVRGEDMRALMVLAKSAPVARSYVAVLLSGKPPPPDPNTRTVATAPQSPLSPHSSQSPDPPYYTQSSVRSMPSLNKVVAPAPQRFAGWPLPQVLTHESVSVTTDTNVGTPAPLATVNTPLRSPMRGQQEFFYQPQPQPQLQPQQQPQQQQQQRLYDAAHCLPNHHAHKFFVLIMSSAPPQQKTANLSANMLMMPLVFSLKAIRRVSTDAVILLSEKAADMFELSRTVSQMHPGLLRNCSFFNGSPRNPEHLLLCGLPHARAVVIMSPPQPITAASEGKSRADQLQPDVATIIVSLNVQMVLRQYSDGVFPPPYMVTDIQHKPNIALLSGGGGVGKGDLPENSLTKRATVNDGGDLTSAHSAGHVYSPVLIESLMAQCISTPYLVPFWECLLNANMKGEVQVTGVNQQLQQSHVHPTRMTGTMGGGSNIDTTTNTSHFSTFDEEAEEMADEFKYEEEGNSHEGGAGGKEACQMQRLSCVGMAAKCPTFALLFEHLLRTNGDVVVALIHRRGSGPGENRSEGEEEEGEVVEENESGACSVRLITNPAPDTPVTAADHVLLLTPRLFKGGGVPEPTTVATRRETL